MKRCYLAVMLSFCLMFAASCGSSGSTGSTICTVDKCISDVYADGLCYEHYMAANGGENDTAENSSQEEEAASDKSNRAGNVYYLGETVSLTSYSSLLEGHFDITMTDYGTYTDAFDKRWVYVSFEVVNTGETDINISCSSFEAYVNNYSADIGYTGKNDLSASLSAGRQTSGNVYIDMNPDDMNNLELELGDMIFRTQGNPYQSSTDFSEEYESEEANLSDFSYNNLYLYGGSYESLNGNGTYLGVGIYSSFDEGNTLGNVYFYDDSDNGVYAAIRDDNEGEGIYTLSFEDVFYMYVRFYQDSDGTYYADIQGLDDIDASLNQTETYIMTEQYIP